jgi:hypothetical protein
MTRDQAERIAPSPAGRLALRGREDQGVLLAAGGQATDCIWWKYGSTEYSL